MDPDQGEPNQSGSETRFEQCVSDPNAEKLGNRWVTSSILGPAAPNPVFYMQK